MEKQLLKQAEQAENEQLDTYHPAQKYLARYANVLVNFALNSGRGIKRGEYVELFCPVVALPLGYEVQRVILEKGGHIKLTILPDQTPLNFERQFYDLAKPAQLDFVPDATARAAATEVDHWIRIIADTDKHALDGIDSKEILRRGQAMKPYRDLYFSKEARGQFTWTLGLYGTAASAIEAGLTLEEYWQQIIQACYLDKAEPVAAWKSTQKEINVFKRKLNQLSIESVHITAENCDLYVRLGSDRQWLGGGGRNIPSFELFTSPDWRGTSGYITFTEPLYRYGSRIENISLMFKNGLVSKATASKNQKLLREMIKTPGADKVGEFSLTDARHSKITKFMAETLYDENVGGSEGNMHLALGSAYKDGLRDHTPNMSKQELDKRGLNDSSVHTDIVTRSRRTVTATLTNGDKRIIYKNGQFTL